ncbi:peptidase C14 caspase catalytic subunit P20 [Fibrella aestuarina BUZ 2]|uniref:Peptidase C14 caspase catalytic subunit P20 n=1 Tax=Fibrella aestuarina BUZ 2 TaxID=1166018 RepID=I0K968_9BACT|nr:caspase family protein [Fibrella aestuarina]CCH00671.1 peptidase C14 caspase catalytic subunit P20 [Fibrella aestuarina BUZ 2]
MKKPNHIHAWLLGLGLCLGLQSVWAQGQTYAVVVGIADYKALTYQTGDLRYADQDARRVAAFLASRGGGQVAPARLRLLTNQQATGAGIRSAMKLFTQAKPTDRIVLYFSGHGLTDSFVPYDVRPDDPASLLTYADIKAAFRASAAGVKLCIADACLSGNLTRPVQPTAQSAKATRMTASGTNVAMLLASRSTQMAVEDKQLLAGTFTYFLLKGLQGEANSDRDNVLTIKELHDYVVPRVRKLSKGKQSPVFYGRFSDTLPLAYF